jgi:hypothetical protein
MFRVEIEGNQDLHHRFGHEHSRKTVYQAQITTFEVYRFVST